MLVRMGNKRRCRELEDISGLATAVVFRQRSGK
jgi:hypothetical protein